MATLKNLRILIVMAFILFFCQQLTLSLYEPTLASPVLRQQTHELIELMARDNLLLYSAAVEMVLLSFAAAALWFAYRAGRAAYILYLILTLADNYLLEIQASSWLGVALSEITFLVWGMILALLFCSPLREQISQKKAYRTWYVAGVFVVFIGALLLSSYITNMAGKA